MTRRERLEMVIANTITDELIEECKAELEKLNASNASRKPTPQQVENVKIADEILKILTDEPKLVDEINESLEGDYKRQRISGILNTLVKSEKVVATDVKVKGKGKRKAYTLA